MRSFTGLLWALGGGVAGFVVGIVVGIAITKLTNTPSREGAAGYLTFGIALIGALAGIVAGVLLYARSAPSGQSVSYASSSVVGVIALVAVIGAGLWAFMNLREAPAMYGGAMADLLLEVRVKTDDAPADSIRWLDIEVQTPKTRPEGSVSWSSARTEGGYRIIPVTQGPLSRTPSRVIVVRIKDRQVELFTPPMKRMPSRSADWSAWYRPSTVEPPYGVTPASPLRSILELRYRIRVYGE